MIFYAKYKYFIYLVSRLSLIAFLTLPVAACFDEAEGPEPGSECTSCTSHDDCNPGLSCQIFTNGVFSFRRCAAPATTSCGSLI